MEKTLTNSADWIEASNALVDGITLRPDDRSRLAASLFHLSMEHRYAIYLLVRRGHYGSAFALLRPQFEAYIRGSWLHHCATDDQITTFMNDEEPPRINDLIADLEATSIIEEGTLSEMKRNTWVAMCGFTHGGYIQVEGRVSATSIEANYHEKNIVLLIDRANSLTLAVICGLAFLIDDEQLADNALQQWDTIFVE